MRTRRASRPSDRLSTTSPNAASDTLLDLVEGLPEELRTRVFTHPSFVEERPRSYERLEFLGDSVLELAIAHRLYERFPDYPEGELTRVRASVVSRASCAVVGAELDLGSRLLAVGGGSVPADDLGRLAANRNVLSALLEAALGALYLQHGFERIREPIVAAFAERIEYALTTQEELARLGRQVAYEVLEIAGPPHQRSFTCAAVVDGEIAGAGSGSSKKAAEQVAAREALARLAAT
jgi:ribonuclease III